MKQKKPTKTVAEDLLDDVQLVTTEAEALLQGVAKPVRKHIFKRFPTLFLIAVTFGVSITFFGIEQLLQQWPWLNGHPWVSFFVGVSILAATGTLYKKLG